MKIDMIETTEVTEERKEKRYERVGQGFSLAKSALPASPKVGCG